MSILRPTITRLTMLCILHNLQSAHNRIPKPNLLSAYGRQTVLQREKPVPVLPVPAHILALHFSARESLLAMHDMSPRLLTLPCFTVPDTLAASI